MKGRCLCGAVTFEAEPSDTESHACHCEMCRHWTGSAMIAVAVPGDAMHFDDTARIRTFQSSTWAERAWCDHCGACLYYRITVEGPLHGIYHVPIGLLERPDDFALTSEIYIDRKPSSYAFAGETKQMTAEETEAMFAAADPDAPAAAG